MKRAMVVATMAGVLACGGKAAKGPGPEKLCTGEACPGYVAPKPDRPVWQAATGPESFGTGADVWVHGDSVILSGYGQVSFSSDRGQTWTVRAAPQGQLRDIAAFPGALLANDAFSGALLRTSDQGVTWTAPFDQASVRSFTSDAGGHAYVSIFDGQETKVMVTTDGTNWKEVPSGAAYAIVSGGGKTLLAGDDLLESFLSEDGGDTWKPVPSPEGGEINPLAIWRDAFYFDFGGNRVAESRDGAKTFDVTQFNIIGGWRNWMEASPDGLFLVTAVGEILRQKEPGAKWETLVPMEGRGGIRVDAVYGGDDGLFVVYDGRLKKWDESAGQLVDYGKPPVRSQVETVAGEGNEVWAAVDGNRLFRSTDGGVSWNEVPKPRVDMMGLGSIVVRGGSVWLVTGFEGIFRTDDAGQTWVPLSDDLPQFDGTAGEQPAELYDLVMSDDGLWAASFTMFFLGGMDGNWENNSAGILWSRDGGVHWSARARGLPLLDTGRIAPLGNFADAGGVLLVGTRNGLYRSVDRGINFEGPISLPAEVGFFVAAVADGTDIVAAFASDGQSDGGLWRSSNQGESWEPLASRPPGTTTPMSMTRVGDSIVVVLARADKPDPGDGVWATSDHGATWDRFGDGTPDARLMLSVASTGTEFLLGTAGLGVERLPLK